MAQTEPATENRVVRAVVKSGKRRGASKREVIMRLLKRARGARMSELQKVTGWQSHSVRAAISGLRKSGVVITRDASASGASIYRVG